MAGACSKHQIYATECEHCTNLRATRIDSKPQKGGKGIWVSKTYFGGSWDFLEAIQRILREMRESADRLLNFCHDHRIEILEGPNWYLSSYWET